ncbi:MAG: PKD domain-containing protein [Faecousia sp.]
MTFEISYERIPEQIINVAAIGEIGKISISWAISAEVDTAIYRIYRKAETETNYTLLQTIHGRDTLSYSDTVVERNVIYSYYVTGVGIYGEESVPSTAVSAQMAIDREAPVITKVWPAGNTRISGTTCLTATVIDNIGVTRVVYQYSTDGESWTEIGNSEANSFAQSFDTTALEDGIVSVRAIAFDAEGNASAPYNRTYYVDNTPPEQVAGVTATALYCSKLTLSWDDVASDDRASFVVQMQNGDGFATLAAVSTIGYNVTGLKPNTAYTFRVACRDTCGNQGLWSEEYTVTTPVDTVAPTITALSPEPCRLNSDLSFSATAKDECGITSIAIQISTDLENWTTLYRQNYSELKESQTCKYTVHSAQYEEGYIYLRAVATDGSGNVSKEDGTAAYNGYLIDRTAPTAPTGVSATGCNGYIAVAWTQGTEADLGTYSVYRATTADGTYTRIAAGLKYLSYYDRTVETDLVYYYKVAVSDTCGNLSGFSETVSAKTVDDTQPPVVNSFSETYHQCVSDSYHTISVLATDNSRLRELVVEYKTAEDAPYSLLSTVTGINDYSKTLSVSLPIAELSHNAVIYLRAYAVDSVGLQSEYLTAEYTVDREAPAVKNFAAALEGNVCTLIWSDCGESDLSGFRVYRSTDGGAYSSIGSRSVKSDGSYSFVDTVSSTATHTYTYKLTAVDKLGNAQSVTEEVTYTARSTNAVPRIMMDVPVYMEVGVENYFDATGSTDDGAIESYLWDFGDGTTSALAKAVKKYAAAGTYMVSLSVTDDNGAAATESYTVTVKERSALGTLNVKVCDEDYHALPGVKVWFDKGEDTETYAYTNAEGIATVQLPTGEHVIAAYMDSKHLPAKKTVTVLSNASRTVSLILVEEELVTGEFEITRMTLDEIVAAGIDIYDPANQNIYQVKVQVTYGSSPLTISYTRNDTSVLSYTITDSNGKPVQNNTVKDSNGEGRVLTPTIIACGSGNADIVAILDIPAQTSYLKDFFDVKLYITNHASEEFDLADSEVTLNIPEGMTLMTGLTAYENSNIVNITNIAGQETVMLRWCLRGDIEGDYDLTADYIGTLTYFDELITATFKAKDPIKVYGLNGIEMSILSCDEIHNGAFYFKIGLENQRDIDLLMPNIGLYGMVENVTESVAHNNKEGDFTVQTYILNACVESSTGAMQYLPVQYDSNGNLVPPIDLLAPGQKLVYEYVAYNAVQSDTVGYFNDAMAEVLCGYAENVVVGSYERPEYSYINFSEKLDRILNNTGVNTSDTEIRDAYQYITTNNNYYYYRQGSNITANVFEELYQLLDTALALDFSNLTDEEQETLMQTLLVGILTNDDVVSAIDDYTNQKYFGIVSDTLSSIKLAVIQDFDDQGISTEDFGRVLNMTQSDISKLTGVLMNDGEDAFCEEVSKLLATRLAGLAIDVDAKYFYDSYGIEEYLDYSTYAEGYGFFQSAITSGMRAMDKAMWQAYVYGCLRATANVEYSTFILEAIISYCDNEGYLGRSLAPVLKRVAEDMLIVILDDMNNACADLNLLIDVFAESVAYDAASEIAKQVTKKLLGTPYKIASMVWKTLDSVLGLGEFAKQQGAMEVYSVLSEAMLYGFSEYTNGVRTEEDDLFAYAMLAAICDFRLDGERAYREFVEVYLDDGVLSVSEATAMRLVNKVMNTSYEDLNAWYNATRYNILSARDVLFNQEITSETEIPTAPRVTLDYTQNQTVQSFSAKYEYCFADGIWITCEGKPISFTPRSVQTVLRVRVAASDENLAGNITTVYIYAQKELPESVTVKFDGTQYIINNLLSGRAYQMAFISSEEEAVDWDKAIDFTSIDGTATVPTLYQRDYVILRSCVDVELQETYSQPLVRSVITRQPLNLIVTGSGSVCQQNSDGYYFVGESLELTAIPNVGYALDGWYVDGVQVSTDAYYIYEMGSGSEIEARFAGAQPERIVITSMPEKIEYYDGESPDMSGFELTVYYEDGSSAITSNYTASFAADEYGKDIIVVRFSKFSVEIPVEILHTEGEWVVTYNATCTSDGERAKYCNTCGKLLAKEAIPATGHSFENGNCTVCGTAEMQNDEALKIKTASISLQSDLSINFYVADSVLEGWSDPYLVFSKALYDVDGNITGYETETVCTYTLATLADGTACHVFKFSGIRAMELGSAVSATIYGTKEGILYEGKTVNYSVLTYANNMLKKTTDAKLKTLLVDLLNYGATAQTYWGYNTANLVNAGLTEEQKACATQTLPELTSCTELIKNDGATVSFKTCSLSLKEKVTVNYYLNLTSYTGEVDDLYLMLSYVDTDGVTRTATIDSKDFEYKLYNGAYYYVANFSGLNAIQMRTVCTAEVFSKTANERISNTVVYSIESYAASKAAATDSRLVELVYAMMKYGDATEAYFLR